MSLLFLFRPPRKRSDRADIQDLIPNLRFAIREVHPVCEARPIIEVDRQARPED
jgi:hypothetical protein